MKKSQRKKKKILLKNQSIARKRKHLVVSWKMIFFLMKILLWGMASGKWKPNT